MSNLRKTEMCSKWMEGKRCQYRKRCWYAHSESELAPKPVQATASAKEERKEKAFTKRSQRKRSKKERKAALRETTKARQLGENWRRDRPSDQLNEQLNDQSNEQLDEPLIQSHDILYHYIRPIDQIMYGVLRLDTQFARCPLQSGSLAHIWEDPYFVPVQPILRSKL